MKSLIPLLVCSALVAVPVGVAATGAASSVDKPERTSAPLSLPAQTPKPLGKHDGYGYRSVDWLARSVGGGTTEPGAQAKTAGASATIVVTATVLPVRTIVVRGGSVLKITTNSPDRRAHTALYVVREGTESGPARPLTPRIWRDARTLARTARAGVGTIAAS